MASACQRSAFVRSLKHPSSLFFNHRFFGQLLSILVVVLVVASVSNVSASAIVSEKGGATLQRRATCSAGQVSCGWFGCVTGTQCPQLCDRYSSMQACNLVRGSDHGCIWWGSQCIPDVQCTMVNGLCSVGCRPCKLYGCVQEGRVCPQGCETLTDADQCNQHLSSNGINCFWDSHIKFCTYAVGSTELNNLQAMPSAIGGNSPAPPPSQLLHALASAPDGRLQRTPDGVAVSAQQINQMFISQTAATGGNGNGASSSSPAPSPSPSPSPSPDGAGDGKENGPLDASLRQTTTDGSNKLWGALCGVAVGLIAAAGIAFLVVQQRLRARRERQTEQRNAEMYNIQPDHRRDSLLPFVQQALGVGGSVAPPQPAAGH